MKNILFLAALESEYFDEDAIGQKIIYTGVGKINAAYATTKVIIERKPTMILNIGTAGSLKPKLVGGTHIVGSVIERDMLAMPLAPRGTVPFGEEPVSYFSDCGEILCATGDSFVTEDDPWMTQMAIDLVDMELFAIAKVCSKFGVPWRSLKYVSDSADKKAAENWIESLKVSTSQIRSRLHEVLDKSIS
jgi:adenosylhomocysteine nucleosidase